MKKNYEYVLQDSHYDCGIASLITIFKYHNLRVSKDDILKHVNPNNGINAYELIKASKTLGLNAKGVKCDLEVLDNKFMPVIAHIIKDNNYHHYIVIFKIDFKKQQLLILDPAEGIKEIRIDDFLKESTKVYIVFSDSKKIKAKTNNKFAIFIKNIFLENKKLIIISLILSFIFIILSLIFNYYLKIIMEYLDKKISVIIIISLIFLFINLIKNIISLAKNKIILRLNLRIDKKINKLLIKHLFFLPNNYFVKKSSGELISVVSDIDNFKEIIIKIFILCFLDLFLVIICLIYISIFNIYYLSIFIIFILILFLIADNYKYHFNNLFIKLKSSKIKKTNILVEGINNINTIKNLHIENKIISNINKSLKEVQKNEKNYLKKINSYDNIFTLISDFFYIIIIFISSFLVINKKLNTLDIIFFSSIYYLILGFITNIMETISMYKMYQISIDKILDILDCEKEIYRKTKNKIINNILFYNTCFSINEKEILKNINLSINKTNNLFIYGKSGIGKSTLINLLFKNNELTKGKILLDNIDLKYYDLSIIKDNITYVSQHETLFNDTVLNNFKMIKDSNKKINKALKTCLFNYNYDYLLLENGTNLSGGERKKLIIARALLKAKDFLILDESFNEIDIKSERIIIKNIIRNYPNITIILISHRKDNIDLFNKIYELKKEEEEYI